MSSLLGGSGTEESLVVTVGPGRESWENYLRQALYHDLMSAGPLVASSSVNVTTGGELSRPFSLSRHRVDSS